MTATTTAAAADSWFLYAQKYRHITVKDVQGLERLVHELHRQRDVRPLLHRALRRVRRLDDDLATVAYVGAEIVDDILGQSVAVIH